MFRVAIIALFFLSFSCATTGRNFDESIFTSKIKKCQTTKAELRDLLGKPRQEGIQGGYTTLQYNYAFVIVGSYTQKSAVIFLDDNNVVVDYALNPVGLVEVNNQCSSPRMQTVPKGA
jgi:hypothetical protein